VIEPSLSLCPAEILPRLHHFHYDEGNIEIPCRVDKAIVIDDNVCSFLVKSALWKLCQQF